MARHESKIGTLEWVRRRGALPAALLTALGASGTARAHHGFGNFDRSREVDLKGTVTGIDFVNPHAYVYFEVTGADGAKTPYRCEMRAATVLRRSGWSAEMFKPGEPIEITGAPDRFDAHSCYVSTILFADGTTADRYAQLARPARPAGAAPAAPRAARLPSGEPNISGDWAPEQLVMTDPRGRGGALVPVSKVDEFQPGQQLDDNQRQYRTRNVELTEAGQKAADSFNNFTRDNPRLRCETTSILFDWTFDGPVNRITQNGETVTLQYGQLGFTRTIHMNAAHPETIEPSRAGHSIGRWENDVLVVDTLGFAPGVLSPPIMNSNELHVIERFSLDPNALTITRSYTAVDPLYFKGEYSGSDTIGVADLPYAPDKCEELTFVDYSNDGVAPGGVASTPGLPGPGGQPGAAGAPSAAAGAAGAPSATGAAGAPSATGAAAAPSTAAGVPAAQPQSSTTQPTDRPAAEKPKSWWRFWEWWD
jgi:hypothetical protein